MMSVDARKLLFMETLKNITFFQQINVKNISCYVLYLFSRVYDLIAAHSTKSEEFEHVFTHFSQNF